MLRTATLLASVAALLGSTAADPNLPGVLATGPMGATNPPKAITGTPINQTSMARLLSANSVDDFCLFAPPTPQAISDSETFEVAWCTQPRNNARLIPDGTITGVSFLKTDFYVQVMGYGDLTKINIPAGDFGGELDPHGATGAGNPVGGNVTTNVTGTDTSYAEWMLYIGNGQFCFRVCTNANSTYDAAHMCWHELDLVGCGFVMPGNYNINGTFETCDADVAYPPGWYPTSFVSGTPVGFSTFAQRFTGTLDSGSVYTVGDLTTPASAFFTPSSSNCVTTSTISNGVALASVPTGTPSGSGNSGGSGSGSPSGTTDKGSAPGPANTGASGSGNSSSSDNKPSGAVNTQVYPLLTLWSVLAGIGAVMLFH